MNATIRTSDYQMFYFVCSFHEMGLFDIPAIINHILEVNGSSSLYYIGHSMGCTVYFTSMCLHPEYNSKIKAMIALAPAMYGKYMPSLPVRLGIPVANFFVTCLNSYLSSTH
jgi:lysosomal acid lipase/cholesteryl ester hydrolase